MNLRRGSAALLLSAALGACGGARADDALSAAVDSLHDSETAAFGVQAEHARRDAFAAARAGTRHALDLADPNGSTLRRAAFLAAFADGDVETASLLTFFWQPGPDDAEAWAAWLSVLLATGRAAEAESLAWESARTTPAERRTWMLLWYEAMAADSARFPGPLTTLGTAHGPDRLRAFDGSSSIILKVEVGGEPVGVFKPHQALRHQNYRGEVASYRLCRLIRCSFAIPVSREAFVEVGEFRRLAGLSSTDDLAFGTRRELIFFDEDGREFLYGVYKDWVPDFSRFPIEYADVWQPLVRVGVDATALDTMPIGQALAGFDGRPRGFYRGIVERGAGLTAADLAQQLSELHVFDLLINNFDRYQPDWFGMNVHWDERGFVSIDNGASFALPEEFGWRATRRRMEQVTVFSRTMIDAIRWMPTDAAFELLFPENPHFDDEPRRFEYFLERRDWLLAYVDALVAEYGEAAVFPFE